MVPPAWVRGFCAPKRLRPRARPARGLVSQPAHLGPDDLHHRQSASLHAAFRDAPCGAKNSPLSVASLSLVVSRAHINHKQANFTQKGTRGHPGRQFLLSASGGPPTPDRALRAIHQNTKSPLVVCTICVYVARVCF